MGVGVCIKGLEICTPTYEHWILGLKAIYTLCFMPFCLFQIHFKGIIILLRQKKSMVDTFSFKKEISPRCDVIYPLAQDRNSFLYHLQQAITCLYLNCFVDKELVDLAVQGWLGLRKQGKVTLRLFGCGPAHSQGRETVKGVGAVVQGC